MKERLEHHYRTLLSGCDGHHFFNKKNQGAGCGGPDRKCPGRGTNSSMDDPALLRRGPPLGPR